MAALAACGQGNGKQDAAVNGDLWQTERFSLICQGESAGTMVLGDVYMAGVDQRIEATVVAWVEVAAGDWAGFPLICRRTGKWSRFYPATVI